MSWSLFYDEPSSWSNAVADVCSTIVNYGVEIPWCVCAQSWTVLSFVTEYAAFAWAAVAAFLRLDEWWCTELSVVAFCALMSLPHWVRRARGNMFVLASQVGVFLAGMAWLGCFLETAAGLQGGVVFGGKLHYPSLVLLSLAVQACRYTMLTLEKEMFGYGYVEESAKDNKTCRTLSAYAGMIRYEGILFFVLAAFGFPQFAQDVDPLPWMSAFPFLAMWKAVTDYFAAMPVAEEDKEKNGGIPQQKEEPAKKKEAPAVPAKPDAAKKDDAKEDEAKEGEEEPTKKTNPLAPILSMACGTLCLAHRTVCSIYSRIAALPWETITSLTLYFGTISAWVLVFWTLTEDPVVLAAPALTHLAPVLIDRANFGKDVNNLLKETCAVATAGLQYYIFKTNIIQYN